MGSKFTSGGISPVSGSSWTRAGLRRRFNVGDLVTLAPEVRYSIAIATVDFGRYIGIITQAYSNREYFVVWTNHPMYNISQGMFNGDHLIKVENADGSLFRKGG